MLTKGFIGRSPRRPEKKSVPLEWCRQKPDAGVEILVTAVNRGIKKGGLFVVLSQIRQFPNQIKFIVGNEAAERFSFYGMRSILTVFMVQYLVMQQADAKATYHLFVSACYLMPLLGAWVSDRFLGKYKTIMSLSIVYCLGHLVLAIWENQTGLYWGLALIAIGSGGIKPCVSAHVGDQFTKTNSHLLKAVFDLFYFSINFGSFFSTLLIPYMLKHYGPSVAFGIPGILMAIATFVFWMGRNDYVHVPPSRTTGNAGFMAIFTTALMNSSRRKKGERFLDAARVRFSEQEIEAARAVSDIIKLFITVSIFWALFDQHGSSWILQAQKMDLNVWGIQFEASQIAALNPIMVMVLIPLFANGLYPMVQRLTGFEMTPLRRMSSGMVLAALSFVFVGAYEQILLSGVQLSVAWHFIPYLIITMAEVMISITGLEFAYTQAPRSMKSTIMSFWLLTVFTGNLITAYISKFNIFEGAAFFYFFAALMAGVSLVFIWSAMRYRVRDYMESGDSMPLDAAEESSGQAIPTGAVRPAT